MLVGYCVRRAGEPGPRSGLTGVGGGAVRLLEAGSLGLWVSEGDGSGADVQRMREHDAVVRAALETATPLPLRFGTIFPDEEVAHRVLESRREEFLEALARVAGRVEMGIRVTWERPVAQPEARAAIHSGTEFLEMRRREIGAAEERRREAEEIVAEIERRLAHLEAPAARVVLARADVAGTLAHLVHRSEITRYLTEVDGARKALPRARLRLSGPWAPYSFV